MISSMTGYGRSDIQIEDKKIVVEIRSVNHRYADFYVRVPRHYSFLEDFIREYLQKKIHRGKINIIVSIDSFGEEDQVIKINNGLAQSYILALRNLRDTYDLHDDISVSTIARYTDLFKVEKKEEDENKLWENVKQGVDLALSEFISMRDREGERLKQDILHIGENVTGKVEEIKEKSPEVVEEYKTKLETRIKEMLNDASFDENRILTEVAIFADKTNINEEIVRLESHINEMQEILESNNPVGRRLDFLIQEMNREINTIGSKCNDIYISKRVVEVKSDIEKMREQVQNIE